VHIGVADGLRAGALGAVAFRVRHGDAEGEIGFLTKRFCMWWCLSRKAHRY
jgi:hypothetical protein